MKVLFTTTYYLPYISGLTLSVAYLAEELAKKGHNVQVLTAQHQKELPCAEEVNGVEINRSPYLMKLSKGFIMPFYLWQSVKLVKNADVVVINLPQFEGFIPAVLSKVFRKRLCCIYGCDVCLPAGMLNWTAGKILYVGNFISLTLAKRVVTYTKDYARHSPLLSKFKDKLSYIYPPVPQPEIDQAYYQKLSKLLPKKVKFVIGVAARLAAEKGVEYLLEAIPYLEKKLGEDFIIVFAGPKKVVGEENYQQKLAPLIEKYSKYLLFLGEIPFGKMGSFYKLLDVLVVSSINSTEAFGMVQVEAMMCGVPVVATDLPGVRVPIQKTGMGKVVPPGYSAKLAEAIADVLLRKDDYLKDKALVEKEFSLKKTVNFYEEIFQS